MFAYSWLYLHNFFCELPLLSSLHFANGVMQLCPVAFIIIQSEKLRLSAQTALGCAFFVASVQCISRLRVISPQPKWHNEVGMRREKFEEIWVFSSILIGLTQDSIRIQTRVFYSVRDSPESCLTVVCGNPLTYRKIHDKFEFILLQTK